jgi:NDP-sugar pyrophosphorylase family protein
LSFELTAKTLPPVAILAGGLATRLHSVTGRVPKILARVADKPFVEHQLRWLRNEGISHVTLCVGHLGEQVREAVGDGSQFGLEVSYSFDGNVLMGTGGALKRALPLLGEEFFVLYGDSYLSIDLGSVAAAFRQSNAAAMMTVFRNKGRWDTSNVLFDGNRVLKYDKRAPIPEMEYIDYGLGMLTSKVLASVEDKDPSDLADIYSKLSIEGQLAGFEAMQRFYEIGTPRSLAEADTYLRSKHDGE